jgi:diguanylate cyclase (GGDEF)-like protein
MTFTALLHILALTAQALLLATLTVWLFRWRSRFGLGFFIAAIATGGIVELRFSSLVAPENAALISNFGGTLLFSIKLFAVLLLYVREDAVEARSLLYGILAGSVVSALLIASAVLHLWISGGALSVLTPVLKFAGLHTFGMAILIVDAILLILTYEWLVQRARSAWLAAVGALLVALSVDNLIFYLIYSRQDGFGLLLLQSFFGKWYAALVYGSCFALTLRWVGFELGTRPTRNLTDVFDTLTFRQRFEALRRRTDFDVLTGLRTRALLEQEAAGKLADPATVLAVIDIDHFKRINDQHGHLRGDAVLRAVAGRVLGVVGELSTASVAGNSGATSALYAYRYGGEEFVVLGALTAADLERIRAVVADSPCDGLAVTISVGAARSHESASEQRNLANVFAIADERLYRAKAEGRNRVVF